MPMSCGGRPCDLAFDNPKLSDPTLNLAAFDYEKLHHRRQPRAVSEIRDVRGHDPECERGDFRGLADQGVACGAPHPASPASRSYLQSQHYLNSGYLEQYTPKFRAFLRAMLSERASNGMPRLIIDGKEHDVPAGITLIQACALAGIEIPRFCYHERLSIAGNCRMCLVEVAGMPKPVASCAMASTISGLRSTARCRPSSPAPRR